MNDQRVTVTMTRTKETKGTVVYASDEHPGVRSIYVGKGTFHPMPERIILTVEAA